MTTLLLLVACTGGGPKPDDTGIDTGVPVDDAVEGLVINEVMTDNDSAVSRVPGDFADWVELYNGSGEAIDLARVSLSDGGDPWTGSGELAAGAHLLLWADTDLPFGLARGGEQLVLAVDGVAVDTVATGEMASDVALVRLPDGGAWTSSLRISPGWTNGTVASETLDAADAIFGSGVLNELRLTLPTSSIESLHAEPYTEVVGSLMAGLAAWPEVNVRLKGSYGSFRDLDAKAAFRLDLGDYESWEWRGMEVLTLNNGMQDPTFTHEYLSYALFRELGVPAPRIGWVDLWVNQEYFGLYILVESADSRFLERWYGSAAGSLFEGSGGVDFTEHEIDDYEHDEGEDDRTQLEALAELLDGDYEGDEAARLDELVDLDQVARFFAVEALIDHWDGYRSPNNYRVHVHPTDGIQLLPWGCDQTFEDRASAVDDADGMLFHACLADEACSALFDQAALEAAAAVETLALEEQLDTLSGWLEERIFADPRNEHGDDTVTQEIEVTRTAIRDRPALLTAWATE